MANVVGTLIILLFTFFFINIATGRCKAEVEIFGVGHGYLYLVYLLSVFALWRKARLRLVYVLCMVAAGLVPTLTFIVEWWLVKKIKKSPGFDEAS
jgi:integral membrane protein